MRKKRRLSRVEKYKIKKILRIMFIIYIALLCLMFALFNIFVGSLNVIPAKYYVIVNVTLVVVMIIIALLMSRKNKVLKGISFAIFAIMAFVTSEVVYYSGVTNKFLNDSFSGTLVEERITKYSVLVLKDSKYNELFDLLTKKMGHYDYSYDIDKALSELDKTYSYVPYSYDNLNSLFDELDGKSIDSLVIDSESLEVVYELGYVQDNYKSIYDFEVSSTLDNGSKPVDVLKESFNVYIGGYDGSEHHVDVNMIATVNPKTHKVLLTSIPRDYYITLSGNEITEGLPDSLVYAGYWGIETSVKTIEKKFDLDINYYARTDFDGITNIVDVLGGVNVYSTYTFTNGNGADKYGHKYSYVSGYNYVDGNKALAFVRERYNLPGSDFDRIQNQQRLIEAIIKKLASPETLLNYQEILNSIKNAYATNLDKDSVTGLINNQIKNNVSWTIEKQVAKCHSQLGKVHTLTQTNWICVPNEEVEIEVENKIKEVMEEK